MTDRWLDPPDPNAFDDQAPVCRDHCVVCGTYGELAQNDAGLWTCSEPDCWHAQTCTFCGEPCRRSELTLIKADYGRSRSQEEAWIDEWACIDCLYDQEQVGDFWGDPRLD